MEEIRIATAGVTASVHGAGSTAIVMGPGAGGSRRTPLLLSLAEALAASGRRAILFNFPYTESGRRAPDPPALLEATVTAVDAHVRSALGAVRVVHGGKSMGGRIASQVAAEGLAADGLVFLGYPLHPPGRPDTLRDRHLPRIEAPMLFLQGTRDAFARPDLLDALLTRLGPRAELHRVEGGDHSFVVPKRAGRAAADVQSELFAVVLRWLDAHGL